MAIRRALVFLSSAVILATLAACDPGADVAPGAAASQDEQALTSLGAGPDAALAAIQTQIAQASKELATRGYPLRIVSSQEVKSLSSDADLEAYKAQALDSAQVIPAFDVSRPFALHLSTIAERTQALQSAGAEAIDVRANIASLAFPQLSKGQRVLKITWESSDRGRFDTLCAFDQQGARYDPIMTNFAFVDFEAGPAGQGSASAALSASPQGTLAPQSTRRTVTTTFLTATMKWIWGSERGRAYVTHGVLIDSVSGYVDQNGGGGDYMSVGSSSHQYHKISLTSRTAKMAGAVALATPTVDFSISYDSKGAKFVISTSGVGSRVTGTQEHSFYQ